MMTFKKFAARSKVRHDFGDMIQVRYVHTSGEAYDTWVSGEEVLSRVRSRQAEDRLRRISKLDLDALRKTADTIPDEAKRRTEEEFTKRAADEIQDFLGDHIISESIAGAIRGSDSQEKTPTSEHLRWQELLHDDQIRLIVLELAWIQLEGSFPDDDIQDEPDDWI